MTEIYNNFQSPFWYDGGVLPLVCYDGFVPLVYFDTLTYCTNAFLGR